MKRNLMAIFLLATGGLFAQYRDGYGQPGGGYGDNSQYDPRYDGSYSNRGDYADSYDVRTAPPPPMYAHRYRRPPMPGPGFVWVDGYWSWMRGSYVWVAGYWTRPPFIGGFWVAPRYHAGRFFAGFWGGRNNRNSHNDRGHGYTNNRGFNGYRR